MDIFSPHLLIIEDDVVWQKAIHTTFTHIGWQVSNSYDLYCSKKILETVKIDLCLIDIEVNNGCGSQILSFITQQYPNLYIIVLSDKDSDQDRIDGLEMGARDYLSKSITLNELVLRLDRCVTSIKRTSEFLLQYDQIFFGEFNYNQRNFELFFKQEHIHLTNNENQVLYYFLTSHLSKLRREFISENILKKQWQPQDRGVDMLISHLRQKLRQYSKQITIKAIRGVGYQLILT